MFLGDDLSPELVAFYLLGLERLVAPRFVGGEAAVEPAGEAAVEPNRRSREIAEQPAVMADEHERRARFREPALQPFDGDDVEMVGGLVEQQQLGFGRQRPGDRRAPRLAAGKMAGVGVGVEPGLIEQRAGAIGLGLVEAMRGEIERRGEAGEVRGLFEIGHRQARLHEALARIGRDLAGGDAQQRRFAGAVAADQRDALARRDRQLRAGEQRRDAEREVDVA